MADFEASLTMATTLWKRAVLSIALTSAWLSAARAADSRGATPLYLDTSHSFNARTLDLISRLTLEEKAMLLNHKGSIVQRFGILPDHWNQCLHGVCWTEPTTMFPVSIASGATWDVDLVHQEAVAISDEARAIYNGWRRDPKFPGEHKGLIYRAPVINIERNPYWGRNEEAYSEDPYLTGRMAVAYVKGLQGDDPKYLKLVATLKHYAVNNVEQNRQSLSAKVPERMLYEYWLPHFHDAIVEGQAQSVMASYNAINGVPSNINPLLLNDILKKQWGFKGFVVSDLGGVNTMVKGHMGGKMAYEDAVAQSLINGCDFSDKEFETYIPAAVRDGKLPLERLDDAVFRVLRDRFRLGEFDPPEMVPYSTISPDVICSPAHRALALKMAQESIVLLKNTGGLLPLDRTKLKKIAVIGPHADRFTPGGYSGKAKDPVKPLQGIRNRADDGTAISYDLGCEIVAARNAAGDRSPDEAGLISHAAMAAKNADVAIVYVGTTNAIESEGKDRKTLALPGRQEELVKAVLAANPKTVVVLMNAGPLAIPAIAADAPAIIEAWWGGVEGGNAIADVLFGNINPGGRLPHTIYACDSQVPPQDEYDVTKGFTYMYLNAPPLFPFGHGLSYTQFEYGKLELSQTSVAPDGSLTLTVPVKNIGQRAGDEVVQLYVHQVSPSVKRPTKELRGFQRIPLAPGESKAVRFVLPAEKLAFYDVNVHHFVVEPGAYDVMVGSSSQDIRDTASVQVKADR
jgi:beta-glucosidase